MPPPREAQTKSSLARRGLYQESALAGTVRWLAVRRTDLLRRRGPDLSVRSYRSQRPLAETLYSRNWPTGDLVVVRSKGVSSRDWRDLKVNFQCRTGRRQFFESV